MKMKLLATVATVSMPLLFGSAYAQTTTAPEAGQNRSADGGAATSNPQPGGVSPGDKEGAPSGTPGATTGGSSTSTSGATGATGADASTPGASGSTAAGSSTPNATATPGTSTMPGSGDASTTSGSGMPGATSSGAQGDAAASTEAITGWSAKDDIIGKSVFNENDEKIGDINDIVVASDGRSMYLLIGAGGFLGMGQKEVAVPFERFQRTDDRILLSGYSKEQLKALPEVKTER